jgi:integrase
MSKRANGEGTISQRKDGSWRGAVPIGYTPEGKLKRKWVYGKTQAEVLTKLHEVQHQLAAGLLVSDKSNVKEYLEEWLRAKEREVKPQTAEDYRYQLEHYVVPLIGRIPLAKLAPIDIQRMVGRLSERYSPQRANKCRRVLSTALTQAVRWQIIPRNPCNAVQPLKVEKREMALWTGEQATRFLDTATGHRLYAAFYLLLSTGLRRGELLGLQWQDIDLQRSTLRVRRSLIEQRGRIRISTPKSERSARRVALPPDMLAVLQTHRARQKAEAAELGGTWPDLDLVFCSEVGTYLHPRNFERSWHLLQERTRAAWVAEATARGDDEVARLDKQGKLLPRIRLHDLRHLHASLAIAQGMDAKVLADRLGHARASFTLDVYTHLFEEQRAATVISIAPFLNGGGGAKN